MGSIVALAHQAASHRAQPSAMQRARRHTRGAWQEQRQIQQIPQNKQTKQIQQLS